VLVLAHTPDWLPWLRWAIAIGTVVVVALLLVAFPRRRLPARPIVALGVLVLLAGPFAFSVDSMLTPQTMITAADPAAGPVPDTDVVAATAQAALHSSTAAQAYLDFMNEAGTLTPGQRDVLAYVTAHAPNEQIQLAVELGSWGADPYLLNSTARVAAFGGYLGLDPSPTATQVAQWSADHQLGFVLLPGPLLQISKLERDSGGPKSKQSDPAVDSVTLELRIEWVSRNCAPVRPDTIGPDATQAGVLFRCDRSAPVTG
ncbi:MAG TPA: hypothetical protein VHZ97_12630, partial [Pseudonocardiaceae bacterium]|nr:hypothetical protein [Pseudonocardiaceae bacterium]